MVFESVITDVLNRFLGDYIENLDSKQLKLGIWGGDVVLNNLFLKQNALKELDLPIQTIYGRLEKLIVKIPWQNLYGASVEARIEGLYLLLAPNNQVEYDEEKETQRAWEHKKNELQMIEDRKKLSEVAATKDDTFVEKLVTQIIKNVQLTIKDIHVRYEDRSTGAEPFAMGLTLSNLVVQTTDESWMPTVVQEMVKKIFKIVTLEGASIYWNCGAEMFSEMEVDERRDVFVRDIANRDSKPEHYKYILGPINSEARLILNPKPEHNSPAFSLPKAHAELKIDVLSIGISMCQYRDIVRFADSMRSQIKGLPYRRYRPSVPYKGNAYAWWQFAFTCVLETEVRRRRRNWQWEHMCNHRDLCKRYGELYKTKLTTKKLGKDTNDELMHCEKSLDVYNLVLIRQRIAMEVELLDKMRKEKKPQGGWFSGWFGGGKQPEDDEETKDYLKRFQAAMTPDEKKKLFAAIDYDENDAPTAYPVTYVDTVVKFHLELFKFNIHNDVVKLQSVVELNLNDVKTNIERRPKNNGLKIMGFVRNLLVTGVQQGDILPQLISSEVVPHDGQECLVDLMFEMNPMDMKNGNRLHFSANPLQVVYDAVTMSEIVKVFNVPSSSALDELSQATTMQINSMKEKSALGLQSVIEKHTKFDVYVKFSAPIVLIPHGGLYSGAENMLVVNLGTLIIKSVIDEDMHGVQALIKSGFAKTEVLNQMMLQSYDRFRIDLTDVQLVIAQSDERWMNTLMEAAVSPMHLICPINVSVLLETCIVSNDPNMPLCKVSAEIPRLEVQISDARLLLALNLIESMTKDITPAAIELTRSVSTGSLKIIARRNALKAQGLTTRVQSQLTLARVKFELQTFRLNFTHQDSVSAPLTDVFELVLQSLTCAYFEKTYLRHVVIGLESIHMTQHVRKEKLHIISTQAMGDLETLVKIEFTQVNRKSPEFTTVHGKTVTLLTIAFSMVELHLYHDALVELLRHATDINNALNDGKQVVWRGMGDARRSSTSSMGSARLRAMMAQQEEIRRKTISADEISFKLLANLEKLNMSFYSATPISSVSIEGLHSEVIVKAQYTQAVAHLQNVTVLDMNPRTLHKIILSVSESERAIDVDVTIYNAAAPESPDLAIKAYLGRVRISFLYWYVTNMLNFVNSFQAAREAIIGATQKAAQAAKDRMDAIYEKATKVLLDINLKAPEVIIPEKSTSLNALLIDLGLITITNTFNVLKAQNENNDHAMVDQMQLKLVNLNIAGVTLNKHFVIVEKVPILDPLSFMLDLNRNLSSWYSAIPDIDVNGVINNIHVQLGQDDYAMIMKILNENMQEGNVQGFETTTSAVQDVNVMVDMPLVSNKDSTMSRDLQEDNEDAFIRTNMRWNFTMHSFKVKLFNVTTGPIIEELTVKTRVGLAELSMEGFLAKGRKLSNNSLMNSVLLMNLILRDTRPNREGQITELLYRTPAYLEETGSRLCESRNMIDATFQTKKADTFVDLRVYSFTFLLSVEYLLKLASFFQRATEDERQPPVPRKPGASAPDKRRVDQASETDALMSIAIKLEKPDIILVENIDDIDTRALILNCEALIKLRMVGQKQTINATISDFQMYTAMFNPDIRQQTKNMFLEPFTLSIAGSTPQEGGLHIEAIMSRIYIGVSVYTIELLNNILKTVSATGDKRESYREELIDLSSLWNMRENGPFWFLQTDEAEDALNFRFRLTHKQKPQSEMCILNIPEITITLQAGVGHMTYPILALESAFHGKVTDWSSQLQVGATLSVQMGYYNNRLALWEPLVEPITLEKEPMRQTVVPWEIRLEVCMNNEPDERQSTAMIDLQEMQDYQPQPGMTIDISSSNNLEVTLTKTGVEVMTNIAKLFAAATSSDAMDLHHEEVGGLYRIVNNTGTDIVLHLNELELVLKESASTTDITLQHESQVYLDPAVVPGVNDRITSFCSYNAQLKEKLLEVELPKFEATLQLPYLRAVSRYYRLTDKTQMRESAGASSPRMGGWGLVSTIKVVNGINIMTLRSILEVNNCFNIPVEIYYMRNSGNELESIATIEPGGSLNVPLHAVYSATSELFFSVDGYSITATPYVWRDLQLDVAVNRNLVCTSKTEMGKSFVIKVVGQMKQIYFENTTKHTMSSTMYSINLRPAVVFKNCLPYNVVLSVTDPEGTIVEPGDSLELPTVEPGKTYVVVKLPNYLDKSWVCRYEIPMTPPQFSVWTLDNHESITKFSLDLGMHCLNVDGSYFMSLYCPFWMINKTGLILSYRKSKKTEKNENSGSPLKATDEHSNVLYHPAYYDQPILFSFNARNFFGKKKACVKVGQGEWCDKFSIDVAGSSGVIICTEAGRNYEIGVQNALTYNGLTKMITFTPYYVIINQSSYPMDCQEDKRPADQWFVAEPRSCVAFWPVSQDEDKLLRVRMADTEEITIPFLITESHTTLLKLKNKYGGINVDIQLTEGAVYINLTLYANGMAPALIINSTPHTMNIWEKKSVHIHKLPPASNMFFTWDYPSSDRVLVWEGGYKTELENELRSDGVGNYAILKNVEVYWVSFLDGMQRVLLFTTDSNVAENAQSSKQMEVIDREVTLSLYGLGLSITNNLRRQEIMYVGIASTGIIWETCKGGSKRYKQMNTTMNMAFEKEYQQYQLRSDTASQTGSIVCFENYEVDFNSMCMLRPRKRDIRRRFQTGVWMQMKSSQHQMQLHAKINRLQIDNQLYDCTFPVMLAPVPPPKSVVVTDAIRPFAELSIVQLLIKNSQIQQYKYFKVLIQEFHVKVDLGLINAIMEVLDTSTRSEEEEKRNFAADVQRVTDPLYSHAIQISQSEQKSFYDLLHFSPLKVHVSFSMSSGQHGGGIGNIPVFLAVLLQGIGVTLTDMQDVIFKLAYFEREFSFLTQKQLMGEATKHYVGQTVKQLYVLVLGLDVIGNPYGLVLGITKGVEDLFYEPFQGAIQGPGEFVEGLAFGVASLFGHTFGGAAGAVSRITGAMGKGIAALSFDKEFQRKRRDQINKRPATVKEGLARGGKGLVMGVVDGVTGVFTKPISGAKEQGIGGFFKGLGKGAVGLVARPTAGVMDFASSSLESVKRVTEFGGAYVHRLRPPRFVPTDRLVKPYNKHLADGNKLLCELEKGKYYSTDIYSSHFTIIEKKEVLLLSDKRIAYIIYSDLFGGWQVAWTFTWQELDIPPQIVAKGIQIMPDVVKRGMFKSGEGGKLILIPTEDLRQRIVGEIERHMQFYDRHEKSIEYPVFNGPH